MTNSKSHKYRAHGKDVLRASLVLTFLSFAWSPPSVLALDPQKAITQYVIDLWTSENGLPQNSVLAVAQTRDGYLWLGTLEGLVRFDGLTFKVFDKANTTEIRSNLITSLCEDRQGNLWIGTDGRGLNRFKDGKFTSYTTRDGLSNEFVRALYEDKEGNLWIGTYGGGLNRLKDGKFTSFNTNDGLSGNRVMTISGDRADRLWVGTQGGGLSKLENGKFTSFTSKDGLSSNDVWIVYGDRKGDLWIGTQTGLDCFKDGKFTSFTTREGLSGNVVKNVLEDREGNLWIGTDGGGLNRFKDGKFTFLTSKNGLSDDYVRAIYEDEEGSLWIGTGRAGLDRLRDPKFTSLTTTDGLTNDVVTVVYEDKQGDLWIGTEDGGLNRLKNGKLTSFTTKDGLSSNSIHSVYEDREKSLWVGTSGGGLSRFKDGKFTSFTTKDGLSSNFVHSICEGKDGDLWMGTFRGLHRFKDGKFTSFTTKDGLSSNFVYSLYEDRERNIWIGTRNGLNRFRDNAFASFTTGGLSNNSVWAIYEDKEGTLWVGTDGGGLIRFKDGRFSSFTTKDGLFDNVVLSILEDDNGNLWMGCNRGVFGVSKSQLNDLADKKISSVISVAYGTADGMRSSECIRAVRTRDGRLWFGTLKGAAVIDPNNIKLNTVPPPVAIERVVIDGNGFGPRDRVVASPGAGELEFQFTALSLVEPKKVKFKYKLEGFDKNWIDAGTARTAHYTNLAPGKYSFRVMACNNDGVWNETGAAFQFYLRPHFYQTYWFRTLIAVGFLLVGFTLHRFRVRTLRSRQGELERLVNGRTKALLETTRELEEANRRQADFVSGVSHELRTPATLIRLYGETLLYGGGFPKEVCRDYYQIITRESERLTHLVDNVLDFSRIDRGMKHYTLTEGDIAAVVTDVAGVHAQHLRRSGFTVDLDLSSGLPPVMFDASALAEAILNLLDNAAKYSGERKHLSVRLGLRESDVALEIEDQGSGIPDSERERVFDQFYRGSNSTDKGGYGLGLFLVKHIMDAHGGTIQVKSEPGKGSLFRLAFPIDNCDRKEIKNAGPENSAQEKPYA